MREKLHNKILEFNCYKFIIYNGFYLVYVSINNNTILLEVTVDKTFTQYTHDGCYL